MYMVIPTFKGIPIDILALAFARILISKQSHINDSNCCVLSCISAYLYLEKYFLINCDVQFETNPSKMLIKHVFRYCLTYYAFNLHTWPCFKLLLEVLCILRVW